MKCCAVTLTQDQRIITYTQKVENSEVANKDINQCGGLWGFWSNNENKLEDCRVAMERRPITPAQ